jgi:hypothetical protein
MKELSETCINNERFKELLRNSKILVSEYLKNFHYFNSTGERNLFQLETHFEHTIFLPNYCDVQLYTKIMVHYNDEIKTVFQRYLNDEETLDTLTTVLQRYQETELNRYYKVINKSIMPELKQFVQENVLHRRLAYTINHPTNFLLLEMFRLLLLNVFGLPLPDYIVELNNSYEFLPSEGYANHLTWYDSVCLKYDGNQPVLNKEESDRYILST